MKDEAAFPHPGTQHRVPSQGMTLRDYFAGQALAGYMASDERPSMWAGVAQDCYRVADAMIAARKEER
jgi:hypothetical protein